MSGKQMSQQEAGDRAEKAWKTVYDKGYTAALAGELRSACPYRDYRQGGNRVTFSRYWRNAWIAGWSDGNTMRLLGKA